MDLQPRNPDPGWIELKAVTFLTDTEHRVEPVKSGTQIALQFDIELEKTQKSEDRNEEKENKEEKEKEKEEENYHPWMDPIEAHYKKRMKIGGDAQAASDKATLEKVLAIIKELHNNGTEEVAFALQHLYRKSSILGEYLKGSDATLYEALRVSGEFHVSLHPVIFRESSEGSEGILEGRYVYRLDVEVKSDDSKPSPSKKQKLNMPEFHMPELSGIQHISKQDYIGKNSFHDNEPIRAEYRYFGGGMFVRPKSNSSKK